MRILNALAQLISRHLLPLPPPTKLGYAHRNRSRCVPHPTRGWSEFLDLSLAMRSRRRIICVKRRMSSPRRGSSRKLGVSETLFKMSTALLLVALSVACATSFPHRRQIVLYSEAEMIRQGKTLIVRCRQNYRWVVPPTKPHTSSALRTTW